MQKKCYNNCEQQFKPECNCKKLDNTEQSASKYL
jgi:hypothetical protein